jgi:hypothetical protein
MNWLINTMIGFWVLLLSISLGAAALIYEVWLRGNI